MGRHANLVTGPSRGTTALRDVASVSSLVHFKSFYVLKADINLIFFDHIKLHMPVFLNTQQNNTVSSRMHAYRQIDLHSGGGGR